MSGAEPYFSIRFSSRIILVFAALAVFASAGSARAHCPTFSVGIGVAGPITTLSAPTVPEGKSAIGIRAEVVGFDPLPSAELERAEMDGGSAHSMKRQQVYSVGGIYGLTDDLTVGINLPYVLRDGVKSVHFDNEMQMSMLHDVGTSNGLGDLTVFAQYRLVHMLNEGIDVSLVAGLKTPTGETDNRSQGQRVLTRHQPGSGSWDPIGGLAVSKRLERLSLHGTGIYTLATEGAQATDLGDRAQVTIAAAYRVGGKIDYGDCDAIIDYFYPELRERWLGDLVLELNGNWQDKEKVSGRVDPSSGGTALYLSPGARVTYDGRYSGSVSVGLPVCQDLNGSQSKVDYRIITTLAVAF